MAWILHRIYPAAIGRDGESGGASYGFGDFTLSAEYMRGESGGTD